MAAAPREWNGTETCPRVQALLPVHFRWAPANLLTNPVLDPYAKMAELKCCAVRLEPAHVAVSD